EDRDAKVAQQGPGVEAARSVVSHLRVDLGEGFGKWLVALARQRGEVSGLADADRRPRLDDGELDRRLARRRQRDHPTTLAAANESDPLRVKVGLLREKACRGG